MHTSKTEAINSIIGVLHGEDMEHRARMSRELAKLSLEFLNALDGKLQDKTIVTVKNLQMPPVRTIHESADIAEANGKLDEILSLLQEIRRGPR